MMPSRKLFIFLALGSLLVALVFVYSRLDGTFRDLCATAGGCVDLASLRGKLSPSAGTSPEAPKDDWGRLVSTDGQQPKIIHQYRPAACKKFPNTSNILLVMKTGASEAYSKIPTQAATMLHCLSDYLIFSDMEQIVAGQYIYDSLDTVLPEAQKENSDFDLYRRQRDCPVDQETCNKGEDSAKQGWALDKYKNIHIAEKTFKLRPGYDWYLYVDADTYVFWPAMVEWLQKLDPSKKQYLGSAAMLGDFPFAHGGSGYIMSNALMKEMFAGTDGVANAWDDEARKTCCGDYLLARAVYNHTKLEVHNTWPTINGEKPHTLQYGSRQWCHPIVTMHHLTAEEVSSVWAFEQQRGFDASPMQISTLYHEFLAPHLQARRKDWDNLSTDLWYLNATAAKNSNEFDDWEVRKSESKNWGLTTEEQVAHESMASCASACEAWKDCMQWKYSKGLCVLDKRASLGRPSTAAVSNGKKWTSGWNVERIRSWADAQTCKKQVKWPNT